MHTLVPVERLSLLLSREARLFETMGEYLVVKWDEPLDTEAIASLKPGDTFQGFECMLSTEEFYGGHIYHEDESEYDLSGCVIHDEGEEGAMSIHILVPQERLAELLKAEKQAYFTDVFVGEQAWAGAYEEYSVWLDKTLETEGALAHHLGYQYTVSTDAAYFENLEDMLDPEE